MLEASLSFWALRVSLHPSWGGMIQQDSLSNRAARGGDLSRLAIMLTVFALTVGDWLRDALDPSQRDGYSAIYGYSAYSPSLQAIPVLLVSPSSPFMIYTYPTTRPECMLVPALPWKLLLASARAWLGPAFLGAIRAHMQRY